MQYGLSPINSEQRGVEDHPLPFSKIVDAYYGQIQSQLLGLPRVSKLCSAQAVSQIEAYLKQKIAQQLGRTLYLEFSAHRSIQKAINKSPNAHPPGIYRSFVDDILQQGIDQWLQQYEVLEQRLSRICDLEIENIQQLLTRVHYDRPSICSYFDVPLSDFRITSLRLGLSDPHRGRQTVAAITFNESRRIIYKPRPVEAEEAWNKFLDWINANTNDFQFKINRTISCDGYGYMAYIHPKTSENRTEAEQYYRRLGALCTLFHYFGATDIHSKNLIAHRSHPIVIDLETLLPATVSSNKTGIKESGLIPSETTSVSNSNIDSSVLGWALKPNQQVEQQGWTRLNTDAMRRIRKPQRWQDLHHPYNHSPNPSPRKFKLQLIDGMTRMHRLLTKHKEHLLSNSGPLSVFWHIPQRFLLRSTQSYANILSNLRLPQYQANNSTSKDILAALDGSQKQKNGISKQAYRQMIQAEKTALWRGDVPYFGSESSSTSLRSKDVKINGVLAKSPFEQLRRNLRAVHQNNLDNIIGTVIHAIDCADTHKMRSRS